MSQNSHRDLEKLQLNDLVFQEAFQLFRNSFDDGLAGRESCIKALRTFVAPPDGSKRNGTKKACAIDVGGTNCRVALVSISSDGYEIEQGPLTCKLPLTSSRSMSQDDFFGTQVDLLNRLNGIEGLPLGYCFSYPAEILPNRDARLLQWTKGIDIPGVVGQAVGALLGSALFQHGLALPPPVVINDTVASLIGGALLSKQGSHMSVGLIAGTGNNMAGFFDSTMAPKLSVDEGVTALNLESGNLKPPASMLCEADTLIDRSDNPGKQQFEKAVSAHYLPLLMESLGVSHQAYDPSSGAEGMSALVAQGDQPDFASDIARMLFNRSADMVATALAALLSFYPKGTVTVLAEGPLFWQSPGYASRLTKRLQTFTSRDRFSICRIDHVNLVGAAYAALQHSEGF